MRAFLAFSRRSAYTAVRLLLPIVLGIIPLCLISQGSVAQSLEESKVSAASRSLITEALDETRLTTLKGNTHPLARPMFDLGTAPASLPMERMLLVLKRSSDQESTLRKLLDDQQDKHSPNYHKWMTPEQFGAQFGPTDADMQIIKSWLQSHGFKVGSTKGRTVLEFSGSASQVQEALHTSIHKYVVNGEQHWANASDPSIPTALTPAVAGVLTLHNFIKKPAIHFTGEPVAAKIIPGKKPLVTFPGQNGQAPINALAPQDYAVIYNINPLYNTGAGGGITIAVVGRSNLYNNGQDVQNFFGTIGSGNAFGGSTTSIILNGPDPGDLGGGEEAEATLDTTWSAAIASNAFVSLVVSATTNTTDGIDLSETYIIENNVSDVMTESFSACELYATDAQLTGARALAEQAAAQGITYIVSSGDSGAEGCDNPSTPPATHPISVNYLASTAFNTAVGGTMFNENGDPTKYWASTAPISETALSYIPEDVWNESSLTTGLWSGSGGASAGNLQAGGLTGGVPKPSWQYGVQGILQDGVRDVPDVSLTAAAHDPYLLCLEGSCQPNSQGLISVYFVSGTSASAPSFAGVMALVDGWIGATTGGFSRQGLANYVLYRLAATQSAYPSQCNGSNTSAPPASTCIFNDVTVGNNVVPGEQGGEYQSGSGYDLATGLGSVNVYNLATQWESVTFNPTTTTMIINNGSAVNVTHGQPVPIEVTVAPSSGTGVPTGDVFLIANTGTTGGEPLSLGFWTLSGGSLSSTADDLPGGSIYSLTARYAGDQTYAPSTTAEDGLITVNPEPSATTLSVLTVDANGNQLNFSSGPFGSFVYLRADVAGQSGHGVPTGSVTFNDTFGPIPGGNTFALNGNGNTANPTGVTSFDTGTHTISANYSGDVSFNASSTVQPQTFTITTGFFVSIPLAQQTVVIASAGGSGSTSVSISNSTGFSGTITLGCSGLPSEATCTFAPASISPNGTPTTTTSIVTITTTAATSMAFSTRSVYFAKSWILGLGLVLSTVLMNGGRRRVRGLTLLVILILIVPACGGGGGSASKTPTSNSGTPTGTTLITVTATSGSTVSTSGFTLVIR